MAELLEILAADDGSVKGKLIVTLQGNDFNKDLSYFGLTINSGDNEIMNAVAPAVQEQFGVDIRGFYKVRKALNNGNVYIIPNSTAG